MGPVQRRNWGMVAQEINNKVVGSFPFYFSTRFFGCTLSLLNAQHASYYRYSAAHLRWIGTRSGFLSRWQLWCTCKQKELRAHGDWIHHV